MPSTPDDQGLTPKIFARSTGAVALADGTVFFGDGFGRAGTAVGEGCFNTAMTGYQEILTDPSYASQILVFTFPHIGNTGTNQHDNENSVSADRDRRPQTPGAVGMVVRSAPTAPSSWRNSMDVCQWAHQRGLVGVQGIDTRDITSRIRQHGVTGAAVVNAPHGNIDTGSLVAAARGFPGLSGMELALEAGHAPAGNREMNALDAPHAVVVDFGSKSGILRALVERGARLTVMPAASSARDILSAHPDGVVLSNGPGDPAATVPHVRQMILDLVAGGVPMLAICLGHQLLALSLGGRTVKMDQGHHGANHPVQDIASGRIYITSMNHAFAVDAQCLPDQVTQTQLSLFDGSNCALTVRGKPVISVQYHPEAAPGPRDATELFDRFIDMMKRS